MRSTVARSVEAPIEVQGSSASSFIYAHVGGIEADGYEWFYGPGVAAAVIPTNRGQACVSVGAPSARFRAELAADVPAAFTRLLAENSAELAARVADAASPAQLRSFPGLPGYLRRPWGPGWALVGDAGYFKDPSTAHGISDALRDAELLAGAVAAIAGGEATEAAAMRAYHRTRDRLSLPLFAVTDTLASYEWDTGSVETHLRAFSKTMADEVEYLLALDEPEGDRESRLAG
jgi:2-polyprenyl-6-methoxyphenol hydroxylase-like FAD-dependent oxidoreductase